MITVAVVDQQATIRGELYSALVEIAGAKGVHREVIPQVDVRSVAPHELKFRQAPQIVAISAETLRESPELLSRISTEFPQTLILAIARNLESYYSHLEAALRLGVQDVVHLEMPAGEVCARLHVMARRQAQSISRGQILAIYSEKGGVGSTTLAAALASGLSKSGSAVLVDGDWKAQSATRFLGIRPFLNEPLTLLLESQRAVMTDSVSEAVIPVEEDVLYCVPPPSISFLSSIEDEAFIGNLLEVLKTCAGLHTHVVLDMAAYEGRLAHRVFQQADIVIIPVTNDAAGVFTAIEAIKRVQLSAGLKQRIVLVENRIAKGGLSSGYLRAEICAATRLPESTWVSEVIPYCPGVQNWPGSELTPLQNGSARFRRAIESVIGSIEMSSPANENVPHSLWRRLCRGLGIDRQAAGRLPTRDIRSASVPRLEIQNSKETREPTSYNLVPATQKVA